jgi:hypothetical protein
LIHKVFNFIKKVLEFLQTTKHIPLQFYFIFLLKTTTIKRYFF